MMCANQAGVNLPPFGFRFQDVIDPIQKPLKPRQHRIRRFGRRTHIEMWHLRFHGEGASVMASVCADHRTAARANAKAPIFGLNGCGLIKLANFDLLCHRSVHAVIDVRLSDFRDEVDAAPERQDASVRRINSIGMSCRIRL